MQHVSSLTKYSIVSNTHLAPQSRYVCWLIHYWNQGYIIQPTNQPCSVRKANRLSHIAKISGRDKGWYLVNVSETIYCSVVLDLVCRRFMGKDVHLPVGFIWHRCKADEHDCIFIYPGFSESYPMFSWVHSVSKWSFSCYRVNNICNWSTLSPVEWNLKRYNARSLITRMHLSLNHNFLMCVHSEVLSIHCNLGLWKLI